MYVILISLEARSKSVRRYVVYETKVKTGQTVLQYHVGLSGIVLG